MRENGLICSAEPSGSNRPLDSLWDVPDFTCLHNPVRHVEPRPDRDLCVETTHTLPTELSFFSVLLLKEMINSWRCSKALLVQNPHVNVGHLICTLNQVGITMASTNNTLSEPRFIKWEEPAV